MTSTGTATDGRPSGLRVFGRALTEGAMGGMFFGGLFGAGIGIVLAALTSAELLPHLASGTPSPSDAITLAAGQVASATTFAMLGFAVGAVLGLAYGIVTGLASGALVALLSRSSGRAPLKASRIRVAAAIATVVSLFAMVALVARPSLDGDPGPMALGAVLFFVAPALIASAFAAWRSPGWRAGPSHPSRRGLAQPSARVALVQQLPTSGA